MNRLSAIIIGASIIIGCSFMLVVPETEACNRSQCVFTTGCLQCDSLILLIIECNRLDCQWCINESCDNLTALDGEFDQAAQNTHCDSSSEEIGSPPGGVAERVRFFGGRGELGTRAWWHGRWPVSL